MAFVSLHPSLPDLPPPKRSADTSTVKPGSLTHVFVWVGILGLGRVGDGRVTVGAVVLTVVVSGPVVRDQEQLLDITLEKDKSP